ncbi:hypothetical protein TNCV_3488051 [Trichonephila clavipes]|nr:hypothetical protein TNCV_3488051 [Trichonephila clavipes]
MQSKNFVYIGALVSTRSTMRKCNSASEVLRRRVLSSKPEERPFAGASWMKDYIDNIRTGISPWISGFLWGQNGNSFQPTREENSVMQIRNFAYIGALVSTRSTMRKCNSASEVLRRRVLSSKPEERPFAGASWMKDYIDNIRTGLSPWISVIHYCEREILSGIDVLEKWQEKWQRRRSPQTSRAVNIEQCSVAVGKLSRPHPVVMFHCIRTANRVPTHRVFSTNNNQNSHPTSGVFPPTSDVSETASTTTPPCHILPPNQSDHLLNIKPHSTP